MAPTAYEPTESEKTVMSINCAIADLIVGYTAYVSDDGAGPYISLHNPADMEDYRCLALLDPTNVCSEDLSIYRWAFWNHNTANVWLESPLGSDATTEEVLAFLAESLAEEARQVSAKS